jgi:hypothetical protein
MFWRAIRACSDRMGFNPDATLRPCGIRGITRVQGKIGRPSRTPVA